jgi:hypothetical protein
MEGFELLTLEDFCLLVGPFEEFMFASASGETDLLRDWDVGFTEGLVDLGF